MHRQWKNRRALGTLEIGDDAASLRTPSKNRSQQRKCIRGDLTLVASHLLLPPKFLRLDGRTAFYYFQGDKEMSENLSEVARLRQQIADEYEAAQRGYNGPAIGTARHDFITKRMEAIGDHAQTLALLVGGKDAAMAIVVEITSHAATTHAP
jgi:hypothetical protein